MLILVKSHVRGLAQCRLHGEHMSKVKSDYLVKIHDNDREETIVHIRNIGGTDHVSICGMDGGVSGNEHKQVPLKRGDKMNCSACQIYYENRHGLNLDKSWIENLGE